MKIGLSSTRISTDMTREEFGKFVEKTVDEVIPIAKQKCGKTLPRTYSFRWLG